MKKHILGTVLHADVLRLTTGIQAALISMAQDGKEPLYPISVFESYVVRKFNCKESDAEKLTEKILNTGIIRMSIYDQCFTL